MAEGVSPCTKYGSTRGDHPMAGFFFFWGGGGGGGTPVLPSYSGHDKGRLDGVCDLAGIFAIGITTNIRALNASVGRGRLIETAGSDSKASRWRHCRGLPKTQRGTIVRVLAPNTLFALTTGGRSCMWWPRWNLSPQKWCSRPPPDGELPKAGPPIWDAAGAVPWPLGRLQHRRVHDSLAWQHSLDVWGSEARTRCPSSESNSGHGQDRPQRFHVERR